MPTPRPIMAARVGAKVATSMRVATRRTPIWPIVRPSRAATIGMPTATIEPKAISRMTMATIRPMPSLFGGSWPANSRMEPWAPTAIASQLRVLTESRIALASAARR